MSPPMFIGGSIEATVSAASWWQTSGSPPMFIGGSIEARSRPRSRGSCKRLRRCSSAAPLKQACACETKKLLEHLAAATMPITATALRKLCQVRNTALHHALAALVDAGQVRKDRTGYALAR